MSFHHEIKNKKINIVKDLKLNFLQLEKEYQLIFTGYMDCSPCIITLKKIQKLIDNNNFIEKTDVVYIARGDTNEYFEHQVQKNSFSYSIIIDQKSTFLENNDIYSYDRSTILINKKGDVIIAGDIFENIKTYQLLKIYDETSNYNIIHDSSVF